MSKEPAVIIAFVIGVVNALIDQAATLGIVLDDTLKTVILGVVTLLGGVWTRSKVSPAGQWPGN